MRIVRWSDPGAAPRFGLLLDGMVADAGSPEDLSVPSDAGLEALLARGLPALLDLEARAVVRSRRPLSEVQLHAPLVRPSKIVCVGLNYRRHAEEQGKTPPEKPRLFLKAPSAIVGPADDIVLPSFCRHGDPEVELGVVIGRRAKRVPAARALSHVAGYVVLNDFTDRKAQKDDIQYGRAKGFDTFCPIGPALVTKEVVGDPGRLSIKLWVDGELRQDATTADLVHDVGALIEYITEGITLEPGDVIGTGTPSGVGVFRDPPVFIQEGQTVRCEIEKIGVLENRVRREAEAA
jgi:2,4-diketo-3-deoxy-L-fuconate hydrolase